MNTRGEQDWWLIQFYIIFVDIKKSVKIDSFCGSTKNNNSNNNDDGIVERKQLECV